MKKIEAYVKPFRLAEIRDRLAERRFDVLRVHRAEEVRPAETYTETVQGVAYEVDSTPRALIVLLVEEKDLEEAIRLIQSVGKTDHAGDGRIVVTHVDLIAAINPDENPDSEIPGRHVN